MTYLCLPIKHGDIHSYGYVYQRVLFVRAGNWSVLSLFQGLVGISRYLGVCFCWEKYQPMMQPMNICVSASIGCNDWLVFVLTNDVGNCFGDSRDLFFSGCEASRK